MVAGGLRSGLGRSMLMHPETEVIEKKKRVFKLKGKFYVDA